MSWFKEKPASKKSASSNAEPVRLLEEFLFDYDRSGSSRSAYAITIWGIATAFNEIFGSLDDYQDCDHEKKIRYLKMIGDNAIESLRSGDTIEASCNRAFVNFLVSTDGVMRRNLFGSIAIFADRLDAIIRYGAAEMDRIEKLEQDTKEFFASEASFPIGTGAVRGGVTEENAIMASQIIIDDLQRILKSDTDYYYYIIEQQARLRLDPGIRTMLNDVPLFEIEFSSLGHEWTADCPSGPGVEYIESIRPGIRHWCTMTVPSLDPGELSLRVIGAAYAHFRITGKVHFDRIRRAYAEYFQEECLQDGRLIDANKWEEVAIALA